MKAKTTHYRTGYWANERGNCSAVHLENGGRTACGYRPSRGMIFQICSVGVYLPYVQCRRCQKIVEKIRRGTD